METNFVAAYPGLAQFRLSPSHETRRCLVRTERSVDGSSLTASQHILSIGAGGDASRSDSNAPLDKECYQFKGKPERRKDRERRGGHKAAAATVAWRSSQRQS
jgi:hypothetical protein